MLASTLGWASSTAIEPVIGHGKADHALVRRLIQKRLNEIQQQRSARPKDK